MTHNTKQSSEQISRQRKDSNLVSAIGKIWLWTGVIVLCVILLFWLFDIGTFLGPDQ